MIVKYNNAFHGFDWEYDLELNKMKKLYNEFYEGKEFDYDDAEEDEAFVEFVQDECFNEAHDEYRDYVEHLEDVKKLAYESRFW